MSENKNGTKPTSLSSYRHRKANDPRKIQNERIISQRRREVMTSSWQGTLQGTLKEPKGAHRRLSLCPTPTVDAFAVPTPGDSLGTQAPPSRQADLAPSLSGSPKPGQISGKSSLVAGTLGAAAIALVAAVVFSLMLASAFLYPGY